MNHVGERIRARREALGLSQRDLARLSGVSAASVCDFEHGRSSPRLGVLRSVARAMGTRPAELVEPGSPPGPGAWPKGVRELMAHPIAAQCGVTDGEAHSLSRIEHGGRRLETWQDALLTLLLLRRLTR